MNARAGVQDVWVVLCHTSDSAAIWAYEGLRARGLEPIELLTAEVLAFSLCWELRLGVDGNRVRVRLPDGREVRSEKVRGVINRIVTVPGGQLQVANPADAEYAHQELYAFFAGWLRSLPRPLLNPPSPQGLSGRWRHVSEWAWLAGQAGLPTPACVHTARHSLGLVRPEVLTRLTPLSEPSRLVFVVEDRVVGAGVPEDIEAGCKRLAILSSTPLLGIEFVAGAEGPWTFTGASVTPDLRSGGEPLLGVLHTVLTRNTR